MNLDELAASLPGARRTTRGGLVARCPAHEDRQASLSVNLGRDGAALVVHCFAGCPTGAVLSALGLGLSDLFPEREPERPPRLVRRTRYELRDPAGELVAVHVRKDEPGGKGYTWELPDGTLGLAGTGTAELPLYGVHRLSEWPADGPIIVTEGEKAADALVAAGIPAVGTVTGAAGQPGPAALAPLAGRIVALWPDNDEPGRRHMARLAVSLDALAAVLVVTWPEAPAHGDAADFLAAHTPDEVCGLLATAAAGQPEAEPSGLPFRTARQFAAETPPRVEWIVPYYVARGATTEVGGRPKAAGKTTFLALLVAAVLDGAPFLGQPTSRTAAVLLSEQPPTSLRATLARAGLLEREDLSLLLWRDARGVPWLEVVAAAVGECRRTGAGLLVVDTLPQFAGLSGDSENDAGAALAAVEPLQTAAADGLAVVVARHDRKTPGEVGDSARGSSAFTGAMDIVISLRRGEQPNVRHVLALSRFEETPEELVIELRHGEGQGDVPLPPSYVVLGSAADYAQQAARAAVLDALRDDEWTPQTELLAALEAESRTARRAIADLLAAGMIVREGAGGRREPYRLRRAGDSGRQGSGTTYPDPPLPATIPSPGANGSPAAAGDLKLTMDPDLAFGPRGDVDA